MRKPQQGVEVGGGGLSLPRNTAGSFGPCHHRRLASETQCHQIHQGQG